MKLQKYPQLLSSISFLINRSSSLASQFPATTQNILTFFKFSSWQRRTKGEEIYCVEMGFNSVYKVLQEVFPQVDSRILRAVAIENSKDADVAVGVVLSEIIPSLSMKSENVATSPNEGASLPNTYADVEVSNTAGGTYSAAVNYGVSEEVIAAQQVPSRKPGEFVFSEFDNLCANFKSFGPSNVTNEVQDQVFVDAVDEFGENISLPGRHQVTSTEEDPIFPRRLSMPSKLGNQLLNDTDGFVNSSSFHEEEQSSLDELVRKNHRSVTPVADVDPAAVQIISQNNLESKNEHVTEPISSVTEVEEPEADVPSLVASGGDICSNEMVDCQIDDMLKFVSDISVEDLEKQEPSGVNSLFASDMGDFEDETSMKAIVTSRSGQMVSAELLEGIIENEKSDQIDDMLKFVSDISVEDLEKQEPSGVNSLFASGMGDFEDETSMKAIVTSRSGQMVSAELLEGIIENEKSDQIDDMLKFVSDISVEDLEKQEPSGVNSLFASDMGDFEDETSMKAIVTSRSGQMVSAELLEGIIENEKSEKIALRSVKNSLLSFINEVDIKEKYVEKAKEEAAHGGLDTLARVEDLKKMLQHAKEANDMHAGEVYGEKAILSTEMRELQSRLQSLSDERVKALAILDEIHQALEVRLVSAETEIREAEREKLEKEKSALEYLAREESKMQKVVQESKILEQQAEENSKLREFLIDRGQLVDMLQGEISVICQDVWSLKTRFDQGVPLTKSLSSSQTTSVSSISSSSVLGASFEKLPEPEVVASPKNDKASSSNSTDDELIYKNEIPGTGRKLVDDGWELFDI